MSRIFGPSIYLATDKNIYDAFQHKAVTKRKLVDMLVKRGIYVSEESSKEDIAEYLSKLNFDYFDYMQVSSFLENPNRREKISTSRLKVETSSPEIKSVCDEIKEKNLDVGDAATIRVKNGKTVLSVNYTEVDFTKTELKQRVTKKCDIEIENNEDGLVIRSPSNKKSEKIVSQIKAIINRDKEGDVEDDDISLRAISDAVARSEFFFDLIKTIQGYKLDDVTLVDVHHQDSQLDEENEYEDDDVERTVNLVGYIKKAALSGGGVLSSLEFKELVKKGFYISRVVWHIVPKDDIGDKFSLEALFKNPDDCDGFTYIVRGAYNASSTGYNSTRRPPTREECKKLNDLIEKSAVESHSKIIAEYGV